MYIITYSRLFVRQVDLYRSTRALELHVNDFLSTRVNTKNILYTLLPQYLLYEYSTAVQRDPMCT